MPLLLESLVAIVGLSALSGFVMLIYRVLAPLWQRMRG